MNRIFHVKIAGGTYLFLILLTAVMVFAFWCMKAMIGLVVALGLIITIERIIHSTYTLTADGKLVVYYGRFYKGKTIPLTDITDVELKRSSGFGGIMPSKYVLIHYEEVKKFQCVCHWYFLVSLVVLIIFLKSRY